MNNNKKDTRMGERKRRRFSVYTLLLFVSLLFCLSACDNKKEDTSVSWSPVFLNYFEPSQEVITEMEDGIQDLDITSNEDNTEVKLTQSLGDSTTMCLAVEVYFDKETVEKLSANKTEEGFSVLPTKVCLLSGEVSKDSIEDESWEALQNQSAHSVNGVEVGISDVDASKGMISYFVSFQTNKTSLYEGEDSTLVLGDFVKTENGVDEVLSEGVHVLSFSNHYTTKKLEFSFDEPELSLKGRAILTPLSLVMTLDSSTYSTYEQALKAVAIVLKDDSVFRGNPSGGGSFPEADKAGVIRKNFREILNLNQVKHILIDDYLVKAS